MRVNHRVNLAHFHMYVENMYNNISLLVFVKVNEENLFQHNVYSINIFKYILLILYQDQLSYLNHSWSTFQILYSHQLLVICIHSLETI